MNDIHRVRREEGMTSTSCSPHMAAIHLLVLRISVRWKEHISLVPSRREKAHPCQQNSLHLWVPCPAWHGKGSPRMEAVVLWRTRRNLEGTQLLSNCKSTQSLLYWRKKLPPCNNRNFAWGERAWKKTQTFESYVIAVMVCRFTVAKKCRSIGGWWAVWMGACQWKRKHLLFPLLCPWASFSKSMIPISWGIPECSSHLASELCKFIANWFTLCKVPSRLLLGTCKKRTCEKYHCLCTGFRVKYLLFR